MWSERKNLTELVGSLLIITAIGILWLVPGHFVQSASALESVKASGRGSIICPDGRIFNNAQIQFESAENKKGNVSSGNWDIELSGTAPAPNKTGSIYRAEITKSHDFILTGTEQQDILCRSNTIIGSAIDITISGQCGTRSEISFSALNGEKGTFTGTSVCTSINK